MVQLWLYWWLRSEFTEWTWGKSQFLISMFSLISKWRFIVVSELGRFSNKKMKIKYVPALNSLWRWTIQLDKLKECLWASYRENIEKRNYCTRSPLSTACRGSTSVSSHWFVRLGHILSCMTKMMFLIRHVCFFKIVLSTYS